MDWLDEVRDRIKRKNQILFAKDSAFLADLAGLIGKQNHRTMILWALAFAEETAEKLSARYPGEKRLETAVQLSRDWAAGKVKMPLAQRGILQAHAVAKEIDSPEDIALCHAVGQACGVVHTVGHAMGFPIYELTAIVRRWGVEGCREAVEARMGDYIEKVYYWRERYRDYSGEWAAFVVEELD